LHTLGPKPSIEGTAHDRLRLPWAVAAEAPVADAYRAYLECAATRSPSAKQYLAEYYAKFPRSSVASRHFEWVCGVVTVRAESDAVDLGAFSKEMAMACRSFAKYARRGDAP